MKHLGAEFLVIVICVIFSGSNLFLYCYYGKLSTDSYLAFNQSVYESNWYLLPTKIQKSIVHIIGNAQSPVFYHGSHIVNLNLETFLAVSKKLTLFISVVLNKLTSFYDFFF